MFFLLEKAERLNIKPIVRQLNMVLVFILTILTVIEYERFVLIFYIKKWLLMNVCYLSLFNVLN